MNYKELPLIEEFFGYKLDLESDPDIIEYAYDAGNAHYFIKFYPEDQTFEANGYSKGFQISNPLNLEHLEFINETFEILGWK